MSLETQLLIILSMNLQSKVIYCIRHFHINCFFFLAEDVLQAVLACGAVAKIVFGTFIVPLCQENKNPVIFSKTQ